MEVLDEIHAANMHNWSTNAGMQHRAENNQRFAVMHLVKWEKTGIFASSLGAHSGLSAGCLFSSYRF